MKVGTTESCAPRHVPPRYAVACAPHAERAWAVIDRGADPGVASPFAVRWFCEQSLGRPG